MRCRVLATAGILASIAAIPGVIDAQGTMPAGTEANTACEPAGDLQFICGLSNVEDLLPVQGGRWLVGSSFTEGSAGLYLIEPAARTATAVALSAAARLDPTYGGCPGAPDPKRLSTHGLDVVAGRGGIDTVYAVNHGGRESIEIFRLRAVTHSAEWIGCVVLPPGAVGNAVAALPGGGFLVTKFRDADDREAGARMAAGINTGLAYRWTPGRGFSEVPDSRLPGANGIIVSRDGRWVFICAYGTREVHRLALSGQGEHRSIRVEFKPDNLRWAPDGKLFVTGAFSNPGNNPRPHGWATVRLDPQTLALTPVVREAGYEVFDDATSAVQVGRTLWFGTFRGERIAYRAAPKR